MVEGMMQHEMVEETAELMWRGLKQGCENICYHQQPCRWKRPDDSPARNTEIFKFVAEFGLKVFQAGNLVRRVLYGGC